MTILPIQALVTKTGTFTGTGVDVSGITGDWTLKIQVATQSATSPTVAQTRFQFTDSVNSFTASLAGPTFSFRGKVSNDADIVRSFKKADFPDLRLGTANALLRLDLVALTGDSTSYSGWVEY